MSEQFEEIEQIPWSALAAKAPDPLSRIPYAVAAAVAVIVLGVVISRVIGGGEEPTMVTLPVTEEQAVVPVAAETAPIESAAAAPVTTAAPLSEADLMAVAIDDESLLAAMYAEWFVSDYFTVDGDGVVSERLVEQLGEVVIPHQSPAGLSYVEWVRAFAVDTQRSGRYMVDVAYQALTSATEGRYSRSPIRAVAITLDIDVDGTVTLVDLPAPAELPSRKAMAGSTAVPVDPPHEVAARALQLATSAGTDPVVGQASRDGTRWRVVVEVGDGSGNRWPMVAWIEDP